MLLETFTKRSVPSGRPVCRRSASSRSGTRSSARSPEFQVVQPVRHEFEQRHNRYKIVVTAFQTRASARPGPSAGALHQPGAHRVELHGARRRQERSR